MTKANAQSVRMWNEFLVVSSLREHGPQRISALGGTTGLTPAPLGQVLRGLEAKGWVNAGEPIRQGPGRPAQVYELRVPPGRLLGIDIGAHTTRALVTDLSGAVLSRCEVHVSEQTLPGQRAAVREAVEGVGGASDVWLAALAVGGHVSESGEVVRSVAAPYFDRERPGELFQGLLRSPVIVINDVRAAVLAEHAVGAGRGFDEVLLAHLGRRPTLGLLLDGRPRGGAHGSAGDMSLSPLLPTEERMDWLAPYRESNDPLGYAVSAVLSGDAAAIAGLEFYISSIAPTLAFAASLMDPELFVVAGALTPVASYVIPVLGRELEERFREPLLLVPSGLDQFAAARGAALLALQRIMSTMASPAGGVARLTAEEFQSLHRAAPLQ